MKTLKTNYKLTSIASIMTLCTLFSCNVDNDDTVLQIENSTSAATARRAPLDNCSQGGRNTVRTLDVANAVNDGKIDDRSCYSNYHETKHGPFTFGNYNIAVNSNHFDTNGLQPRIERSLNRSNNKVGSYVQFNGVFRILEVGDAGNDKDNGTYIAQAKGKHSKRPGASTNDGSPDPAICLFIAKPVYGVDKQGRTTQVSFNIYREQIKTRGGSGVSGRELVFLKNIKKGHPTAFELSVGFRTGNGQKVHYANAKIGGQNFFWNIPEATRGLQSGIRYGAYRVKGGRARIQWANTKFVRVNK